MKPQRIFYDGNEFESFESFEDLIGSRPRGPINEHGDVVKRTEQSHPYNFDGYVKWRGGANKECNGTVYSDRLFQWDYDKAQALVKKHMNSIHDWNDSEKVQAFLRDYNDDQELKLILIMKYCNQASGYPVWRFDYNSPKAVEQLKKLKEERIKEV